jgi:REP element-mobilizing transposase RayT
VRSSSENHGLDRVCQQLRSTKTGDISGDQLRSGIHSRGYLPHVKREGAEYFVTFRLGDSLPKETLLCYAAERAEKMRAFLEARRTGGKIENDEESIDREYLRKVERGLDLGAGACHLRRPEIANLVAVALKFFHQQRYSLREWVVMPNHVHVLAWPLPNYRISDIVKTWKQFTSMRAKRMLGLAEGRFWQPEAFDHWIRGDDERARIVRYIRNNPVTARLCARPDDWRWSSAWRDGTKA